MMGPSYTVLQDAHQNWYYELLEAFSIEIPCLRVQAPALCEQHRTWAVVYETFLPWIRSLLYIDQWLAADLKGLRPRPVFSVAYLRWISLETWGRYHKALTVFAMIIKILIHPALFHFPTTGPKSPCAPFAVIPFLYFIYREEMRRGLNRNEMTWGSWKSHQYKKNSLSLTLLCFSVEICKLEVSLQSLNLQKAWGGWGSQIRIFIMVFLFKCCRLVSWRLFGQQERSFCVAAEAEFYFILPVMKM